MEEAGIPHIPSCRKQEALSCQGSLVAFYQDQNSHVLFVLFLYVHNPLMDGLVPPCSKVNVAFVCELMCFAFVSIFIMHNGDVEQGHTSLWYVCFIARIQNILLISTCGFFISGKDFSTSIWCWSQVDGPFKATGFNHAGDLVWDPDLLPDLDPEPQWLGRPWVAPSWSITRYQVLAREEEELDHTWHREPHGKEI